MRAVPENRHQRPFGPTPGNRHRLGRRLRAGLVTPHSGGPGTRPGGITTPLRGARWTGPSRASAMGRSVFRCGTCGAETAPKDETWTWKRGPGNGNRRSGAPRGDAPCAWGAHADKARTEKWRLSAPRPLPFFRGRRKSRKTRAHDAPREQWSLPAWRIETAATTARRASSASARNSRARRPKSARERDSMRRGLFTAFRLWTVCPDKRCKRARALQRRHRAVHAPALARLRLRRDPRAADEDIRVGERRHAGARGRRGRAGRHRAAQETRRRA